MVSMLGNKARCHATLQAAGRDCVKGKWHARHAGPNANMQDANGPKQCRERSPKEAHETHDPTQDAKRPCSRVSTGKSVQGVCTTSKTQCRQCRECTRETDSPLSTRQCRHKAGAGTRQAVLITTHR